VEQAKELADLGATIELTALSCVPVFNHPPKSAQDMAETIRTIGHERCTLSTDYGWSTELPHPAAGLKEFLEKLWEVGVTQAELTRMVSTNPSRLLSIN
jgi:microsomal dipeptidase-like Zn-dependent dipeptidase